MLMVLTVAAVAGFNGNSTQLGNAYGAQHQLQGHLHMFHTATLLFVQGVRSLLVGNQTHPFAGLTISVVFLITTCFVTLVMILDWRLSALLVIPFFLVIAFIEGAFVSANALKVGAGGGVRG